MEDLKQPLARGSAQSEVTEGNFLNKALLGSPAKRKSAKKRVKIEIDPEEESLNKTFEEVSEFILKCAENTIATPFSITCLDISEETETIVFGSLNGNISRYDLKESKIVDDLPLGIGLIRSIRLDEQNNIAIIVGEAPTVKIYNLPRFELERELEGHTMGVNRCEIKYDTRTLYTISDDSTLRVWDLNDYSDKGVLMTHAGPGKCVALSFNDKYIFSGGDDFLIRVYDTMIKEEILNLKSHTGSVLSLAVNEASTLLASGGADLLVIVWNILDFTPINVIAEHTAPIIGLRFTEELNVLISGSDDCSLRIWDLEEDRREIVLNSHSGAISDFLITADNKLVVSCSVDQSIKIWTFPEFMQEVNYKVLGNDFNSIIETKEAVVSCGSDHKIRFWYRERDEAGVIHSTNGVGLKVCVSIDEVYLAVADDFGFLYVFKNSERFPLIKEFQAHKGSIRDMCFIKTGELVTGGGDSKLLAWNLQTWESKDLKGHQQSIWCIGYTPFQFKDFLVSGSSDKTIRIWDLETYTQQSMFKVAEQATALCVSPDGRYVISGGILGTLTIWSISEKLEESIFHLQTDTITGLYVTSDGSKVLSVSKDASLHFVSLIYRVPLSFMTRKQPILCLAFTESLDSIITGEHQMIYIQDNPLTSTKTRVLGPEQNVQKFMTYMKDIITGQTIPHDPTMDQFLIVPQYFNSLHIFTFLGHRDHLLASLVETAVMIPSFQGHHPLYISLLKGIKVIRDDLVDSLIRLGTVNPFVFQSLENVMILMNQKSFPTLGDLYEALYQDASRKSLPKFCVPDISLPLVFISDNPRVRPEDFFEADEVGPRGQGIMFKESYVRIPYIMGSRESLEFLDSLAGCSNTNVLRSTLVQSMIRYKWDIAKPPMMVQGLCFYFYLTCLGLFTALKLSLDLSTQIWISVFLFFINTLLILYEAFQISVSGAFYFTYFWNYIDWSRGLLLYAYIISLWFGADNLSILSLVIFLSFMRGITYFRLFNLTRYLVNLIFTVFADIGGFLVLLFYSILAFCFLFIVLTKCTGTPEEIEECQASLAFDKQLLSSYNLVLGGLDSPPVDLVQWFCCSFALLINPVIMLNLLVSVVGDTYDMVMNDSLSADMAELMDMIREVENMMFFRRENNLRQFFQEATGFDGLDAGAEWEGKMRALQASVERIETRNEESFEEMMKKVKAQDKALEDQEELIERLAKALTSRKKAMEREMEEKVKS